MCRAHPIHQDPLHGLSAEVLRADLGLVVRDNVFLHDDRWRWRAGCRHGAPHLYDEFARAARWARDIHCSGRRGDFLGGVVRQVQRVGRLRDRILDEDEVRRVGGG
jgi:hypothetical protein